MNSHEEQSINNYHRELIDIAKHLIDEKYNYKRHQIASVISTKCGQVFTGIHLGSTNGRASVCAESIAIGKAISEGFILFDYIVSVRHPRPTELDRQIKVVPPCGICRELLSDFAPGIKVILPEWNNLKVVGIESLLPYRFIK